MNRDEIKRIVDDCEKKCVEQFQLIDDINFYYSEKVLNAMQESGLSESSFSSTTGYGYNDIGRDTIENIYKKVFDSEDALVRNQFVSGSHALAVTLFALLRPEDTLLSISGVPYDTLHEVIGIKGNASSLAAFGVKYAEIDLINNDFDYEKIEAYLNSNKVKVIEIQRSKGYSTRDSLGIEKLKKVINLIKNIDRNIIVMIDNCYCEFVEKVNPIEVGADIVVGSLIKNLGGGIAPNGAYVVGKKKLVDLVGERLTLPGEGREVGPTLGINKQILQGLFLAPSVVASSLKTAILTSAVMDMLGYMVRPKYDDKRVDIVQNIEFNDKDKLVKFVLGIQAGSPVDSNALPIPWDMPGYDCKVIMAAGTFVAGASIELSADAPIREPYVAYFQGGLTYEHCKLTVKHILSKLI